MSLQEILEYRRSVRYFDESKELDTEKVKRCIELATLAPNSSNMQLWEFYHITDSEILKKISHACLDQNATKTAKQIVVFITRRDLHRKRSKAILEFEKENIARYSPPEKQERRWKDRQIYYNRLMPFMYSRFFRLLGFFRKILATSISLFRPMVTSVSESDMRVVVHKTCGLAAQTFMMAMAEIGYDTCPLEGFDSRRVQKLLKLPCSAEINMVIPCGIRKGTRGIWGERFRVPFEEVYKNI
ncbi:MAG: nitroreductase family protein [Bacteroidota bacterium]|jgi:nitroreductase|nr:nitroreductase family protein [Bacteroidota bacterium]NLS98912.1 nitroreductase family protein [Bacteroidales bacterium]HNZ69128.1 nitroreductase family protein [Prolixibacteraceae bacterium]HOC86576.1 nitroreductase family protein [Prolixibacteraceae bacterium]HOG96077.1 nitroreductase family protein [Prolixibacteraceae bacterium]